MIVIADLIDKVHQTESDFKEVIKHCGEFNLELQEKLQQLHTSKQKEVMENISFGVIQHGQKLFSKHEKADCAYIVLSGEISFYNDSPSVS